MNITSAQVIPGCISCKNCENICPEIFKVDPTSQIISDKFNQNAMKLLMAEKMCPVNVIKVEKEGVVDMTYSEAILTSKQYLTPDVVELIFSCENFEFIAGQYVSLQMSDVRGDFSRSYSIASATKNSFTLTVKLLKKGRGSDYLRKLGERTWTRGFFKKTKIEYLGPLGDFKLQDTNIKKILIATGTGLAPMMTMLDAIPEDIPKLLVFGGRYEEDIFYRDKLEKYKNLELRICVSRPSKNFSGNKGRVTDYIHDVDPRDEVYICGNPEMVRDVRDTLKADGHDASKIFYEDFTLAHTPLPLWQDIFYQGNLRGIDMLNTISIYLGALVIPVFYFFAVWFNWLGIEILGKDIYSILFGLSWITVVCVMFIRPLADIFPKYTILRKLVVLRKGFGIISASIIVCILLAKWIQNPFTFSAFFTLSAWSLWMGLCARLSEVTAIILLATSNTVSQRILGTWWKRIQKTSYVYFVTGGILAAQWSDNPNSYYITIGLLAIVWFLARFEVKFGGE